MRTDASMNDGLLDSVIEQLKNPLLTIQLMAEMGQTDAIREITNSSLRLLDDLHYVRDLRQTQLDLSPVNLAAVCDDIAHRLTPLARMHNISIENQTVTNRPVLSHRQTLEKAFENMVRAVFAMSSANEKGAVILSTAGSRDNVRLGVYSSRVGMQALELRKMRELFGQSRRPLPMRTQTPVTELYVADRLLNAIGGRMRTAISFRTRGLATTLSPSNQLALLSL